MHDDRRLSMEEIMREERDPVCGMSVDPASAPAQLSHAGHTHYFCSQNCRDQFEVNPEKYEGMERHEPPRTTQGDMTSPKFGSAGSGGAEFEQIPEQHEE
jgi:YHS domain-containing protein